MNAQKESPRWRAEGEGEKQLTERLSVTTLAREAETVNIKAYVHAVGRAMCGSCGFRWPWPPNVPAPGEFTFVSPTSVPQRATSCPRCHTVGLLTVEPADEVWWGYASRQPRRAIKARSLVPSTTTRPDGDTPSRQLGGVEL